MLVKMSAMRNIYFVVVDQKTALRVSHQKLRMMRILCKEQYNSILINSEESQSLGVHIKSTHDMPKVEFKKIVWLMQLRIFIVSMQMMKRGK